MAESRSKSGMGGKQPHGEGTRVSEYVETPVKRECRTCEYFLGKNLCRNEVVSRDREVETDKKTGLKIVSPINGCCRFWSPEDDED